MIAPPSDPIARGQGAGYIVELLPGADGGLVIALTPRQSWNKRQTLLEIAKAPPPPTDPVALVEAILKRWPNGPRTMLVAHQCARVNGDYIEETDAVRLFSNRNQSLIERLITWIHEHVHALGVQRRMARASFRDYHYSANAFETEEAIAILGSHLIAHRLGIQPLDQGGPDRWLEQMAATESEEAIRYVITEVEKVSEFIIGL